MNLAWMVRRTVLDLRRQGWPLAAVAAGFAVAALLVAGYRLGGRRDADAGPDRKPAAATAGPPAQVIAYLRDDLEAQAARRLRDVLAGLPGVQQVATVSGEEALIKLRRELGERARLLDGADDLLPASLEVWLSPGGDPVTRARQLAWRLQRIDGIVEVDVIDARADQRIDGWAHLLAQGHGRLGIIAALGAAAALLAGLAAGRRGRRDELRVLLSLGFTRRASLAPAVALTVAAGMVGTALGLGAAQVAWRLAATSWGGAGTLAIADWGLGLLAAALLGLLAGVVTGLGPDLADVR